MLSKDIWPVAQFSRLSFDTTCLYVFTENKLISNVKKVSFSFVTPCNSSDVSFKILQRLKLVASQWKKIKFLFINYIAPP